jgi:hypothetical protein
VSVVKNEVTYEAEILFGVTSAGCTLQATAAATSQLTKSNGASMVIQTILNNKRSTKPFSLNNES